MWKLFYDGWFRVTNDFMALSETQNLFGLAVNYLIGKWVRPSSLSFHLKPFSFSHAIIAEIALNNKRFAIVRSENPFQDFN